MLSLGNLTEINCKIKGLPTLSDLSKQRPSLKHSKEEIFRLKGTMKTIMKANISIYENETMTVSDTGYLLWILDNYKVGYSITLPGVKNI